MNIEERIDKEIKSFFLELPEVEDIDSDPDGIRRLMIDLNTAVREKIPKNKDITIEDIIIPGPDNGKVVPVRTYSPVSKSDNLPALLWFHGGGFILGTLDMEDPWCSAMAHETQCKVISVDYRLAPEHPFPAGVEDCYSALLWAASTSKELGIDKTRIGTGGVSAGGNMAAALTLMARDREGPELAFQFLIYPCLDDRHNTPSSYSITNKRVWHRQMSIRAWEAYLGDKHKEEVSCYAAPARAENLSGLPPAYVTAAELDLLRDEDIEYAVRLMRSGVNTELHVFPGVIHGYEFYFHDTSISKKAREEYLEVLKRAFAKPLI